MIDFEKLKEEQSKLSKKVIIKDELKNLELVAGTDASYNEKQVIAAIVVCNYKTLEVKEQVYSINHAKVPYQPGFFAYREGPAISEAFAKLKSRPDVLIFDGNGILHPRRCGIASHMGILLEQASFGITKSLLLGDIKKDKVYVEKEPRAEIVNTKEHANPVYVSPGHKITLKTCVQIVKNSIRAPHKLPEPLHLAHKYANKIRDKIKNGELKLK